MLDKLNSIILTKAINITLLIIAFKLVIKIKAGLSRTAITRLNKSI